MSEGDILARVAEVTAAGGSDWAVADPERSVTYAELEVASNRIANHLQSVGVGAEAPVALLIADRVELIAAVLGVLKAGAVFVPLDPFAPPARVHALLGQISARFAIAAPQHVEMLDRVARELDVRPRVIPTREAPDLTARSCALLPGYAAADPGPPAAAAATDTAPAYIFFTSGSTGRPKPILGCRRGVSHFVDWEIRAFGMRKGARVSQLTRPTFDAFLRDVFVPLCAGGTVCVPPLLDGKTDPASLAAWLDASRIEVVHCVPTVFRALLREPLEPRMFGALEYVALAGEVLHPSDVARWTQVFGDRIRLVNLYGASETTMVKFCYFVRPTDAEKAVIPIGTPIEGARAAVVGRTGEMCGPGEVGEIYIRTPYRTLGYYERPDLTREVFVTNPFTGDPSDVVYKTGDLGRLRDDGTFELVGRIDDQLKVNGVRVEPAEIEAVLRRHPQVRDAAVVGRVQPTGDAALCAHLVCDGALDAAQLRRFAQQYLPEELIPATFVPAEALPLTPTGKVDRRALATAALAETGSSEAVAPRTPSEETVAGIWCELLGVEGACVFADFFRSGGHSLLAVQLLARLRDALSVEVPLATLFENPTIAGIAAAVEDILAAEPGDELAQLLDDIDRLSPAELSAAAPEEPRQPPAAHATIKPAASGGRRP